MIIKKGLKVPKGGNQNQGFFKIHIEINNKLFV